jgi:hypothetical protein
MNRYFKLTLGIAAVLLVAASWHHTIRGAEPSAPTNFVLINDNVSGPNTVTGMAVQKNGALKVAGKLKTGGQGTNAYWAVSHTILTAYDDQCIIASDAGSSDIATFTRTQVQPPKYVLKGRYSSAGLVGDAYGIPLTKDINTDSWLYAAYNGSLNLAVWAINGDCSLGVSFQGTPNYVYSVGYVIADMTALANASAVLVTLPEFDGLFSYMRNADGSLTYNGYAGLGTGSDPLGIIADATATYAVVMS